MNREQGASEALVHTRRLELTSSRQPFDAVFQRKEQ